jgi:DNA polymerase-1
MLVQVHDELLFEVPKKDADKVKAFISKEMCDVVKLDVPLMVDVGVGKNWSEC